ncbi:MAG: tetratricopeptide repeat protein [Halioglobus sp.]
MAIRGMPKTIPVLVTEATNAHRGGRVAEAANLYQQVLQREPDNLNALNLFGVLALQAGEVQQAIASIEHAIRVDASRAPIHFNLGNAYLQAGQAINATNAYRRALAIDNSMVDAWCGLAAALTLSSDYYDAIAAAEQALLLSPESVEAHSCIGIARQSAGEFGEAIASYQRALEIAPDNPQLLNKIGFAHYEQGQYEEAAQVCREATRLAPEFGLAYFNLGLALTESGRFAAACKALARAGELVVNPAVCCNALGRALLLSGRHAEALREFTQAAELDPQMASAHNNLGLALQRLGRLQDAIAAYQRALEINSDYSDAWLNLAVLYEQSNQLENAQATVARGLEQLEQDSALTLLAARLHRRRGDAEAALALLEQLPVDDLPLDLRRRVLFEQGRLADLTAREDDAFGCFEQANALSRSSPAGQYYLHRGYAQQVVQLARGMAGNWAQNWQREAFDSADDPVFLVGFPRSGTTLLEQVLTGHPGVVALEEQALVAGIGRQLASDESEYPALLGRLPLSQRRELRAEYLQLARARANWQPGQLLLDKFPLNAIHLPLIHCLFPDAKLLLALRHPCDIALSCFMQDFELNEAMVNFTSLQDTAALYDAVLSICDFSRRQLPLQVHEVRYENLVDNLEGEVRSLLGFLGLEWRDEVLDFVATAANKPRIQTPSYEQVSRPLYHDACLRWQRYRRHLLPLEPLLRAHCERLGYTLAADVLD